ncbi:MAG TPA: YhbY family RNA-binding protein [Opitutales bacterium]|nr:YhbY family RNA-binding protein [Opitutales bacterium]
MDTPPLTSAEKKKLRGMAQRLKPIVHIGKHGLTESVLAEIETALTKNGLIKIRFESDRDGVKKLCSEIPEKTGSEFVGSVGKTAVFFRDMPEEH